MRLRSLIHVVFLATLASPQVILAAWGPDGIGLPQIDEALVAPHPSGGVWCVTRLDDDYADFQATYIQHYDALGQPEFVEPGILLSDEVSHPGVSRLAGLAVNDAGELWVVQLRLDGGEYSHLLHRVLPGGSLPLGTAGVEVGTDTEIPTRAEVVTDAAGRVFLGWENGGFSSPDHEVRASGLDASGTLLWGGTSGALLASESSSGSEPSEVHIATDGSGRFMAVWQMSGTEVDVHAQYHDGTSFVGAVDGTPVLDSTTAAEYANDLLYDGNGGYWLGYVRWFDGATTYSVRAGELETTLGPVDFDYQTVGDASASEFVNELQLVGYGQGATAFYKEGTTWNLDRFSDLGDWFATTPLDSARGTTTSPAFLLDDGVGGVVVAAEDFASDTSLLQRVDAARRAYWPPEGRRIAGEIVSLALDPDAAYAVIEGTPAGGTAGLSLQRFDLTHAGWGHPEPRSTTATDIPNDEGGFVAVNWLASEHDELIDGDVTHYSLWRAVDAVPAGATLVTLAEVLPKAPVEGVVYRAAADWFWEYVTEQPADRRPAYSKAVATRANSTAGNPQPHQFQVVAHTADPTVSWAGDVAQGESVDNLAPAAPAMLTATRAAGDDVDLEWELSDAPDAAEYLIYRSATPGVTVDPGNLVGTAPDAVFVDPSASTGADWYYVVTARDVHGNEGSPSPEASVAAATAVELPSRFAVGRFAPNPFNPRTTLSFSVPTGGSWVKAELFDVAGRRVRTLLEGEVSGGTHQLLWDGTDSAGRSVASGSYLLRVRTPEATVVRRGILVR